jgi:hypothetical protein
LREPTTASNGQPSRAKRTKNHCKSIRGGAGAYEGYLPTLAREGASLKSAIFTATNGTYKSALVQRLELQEKGTLLTVYSDSSVEVPWNFVFVGNNAIIPAANGLEDFKDFWTSRFKIRIRFSDGEFSPLKSICRDRVRTLLAIHQSRFRKATDRLVALFPELRTKIERLLQYKVGATPDWEDCRKKWAEIRQEDSILYVFAHRDDEGNLCLEEREKISAAEAYRYQLDANGFAETFRKETSQVISNTLCFINGCRTVDGDWGNSLLSTTSSSGFQGFIGSEAEISNDWATKYAIEFLFALLEEGKSVDEAYEETRSSCFPMSLWYSCCAQPDFRITKE